MAAVYSSVEMSETSTSVNVGRPGKKIAQSACETCRKKRTRCVREQGQDACEACRIANIDCVFSGIDKRKESIKSLRARLANLEDFFTRLRGAGRQETQNILQDIRRDSTNISSTSSQSIPNNVEQPASLPDGEAHHAISSGLLATVTQANVNKDGVAGTTDDRDPSLDGGDSISSNELTDGLVLQKRLSQRVYSAVSSQFSQMSQPSADSPSNDPNAYALLDRLVMSEDGKVRAVSALSFLDLDLSNLPGSTRNAGRSSQHTPPSMVKHASSAGVYPGRLQEADNSLYPGHADNASLASNAQIVVPAGVTEEMIDDLLTIYFLWDLPEHPLISRPAFLEHMATGGPYFSSLLLNAILAWASTLSARADTRGSEGDVHSSGDYFARLAEQLLAQQIDAFGHESDMSLCTIQASALLTLRHFAIGQQLKAWLHIGTCARLVLDAGLHLNAGFLTGTPGLSTGDLYVRSRTFWGVWFLEQEFSIWFGRSGPLRDVVITCPKPGDFDTPWRWAEDFDWWKSLQLGQIIASSDPIPTANSAFVLWPFACGIADIFASSMRLIYYRVANRYIHSRKANGSAILESVMCTTRQFMSSIPQAMPTSDAEQIQTPSFRPLPLLLYVHMMAHCHIIIMNRPFLVTFSPAATPTFAEYNDLLEDSPLHRCIGSALGILALAQRWKASWDGGLRTAGNGPVHMLLTAATIFLREMTCGVSVPGERSTEDALRNNTPEQVVHQAHRRQLAREKLVTELLPLLQEIGLYRKGSQQTYELLKTALEQRDVLVQSHLEGQASLAETAFLSGPETSGALHQYSEPVDHLHPSSASQPHSQDSVGATTQGTQTMPIGDPLHYLSKTSIQLSTSGQDRNSSLQNQTGHYMSSDYPFYG